MNIFKAIWHGVKGTVQNPIVGGTIKSLILSAIPPPGNMIASLIFDRIDHAEEKYAGIAKAGIFKKADVMASVRAVILLALKKAGREVPTNIEALLSTAVDGIVAVTNLIALFTAPKVLQVEEPAINAEQEALADQIAAELAKH